MEVVLHSVSQCHEAKDGVPDCCRNSPVSMFQFENQDPRPFDLLRDITALLKASPHHLYAQTEFNSNRRETYEQQIDSRQ